MLTSRQLQIWYIRKKEKKKERKKEKIADEGNQFVEKITNAHDRLISGLGPASADVTGQRWLRN